VVRGLCNTIREELADLAQMAGRATLEAVDVEGRRVRRAQLHGALDPALRETLTTLCRAGRATAPELHAASLQTINVTAWNNRLAELYAKRLATRERDGKRWIYESVAAEVLYG